MLRTSYPAIAALALAACPTLRMPAFAEAGRAGEKDAKAAIAYYKRVAAQQIGRANLL